MNAPGPDRALPHLTMKNMAQLLTTLAGEKHFIVEGLTDDIITLAANTLAATTEAWDNAVGHPTAHGDRVQDTEDTLTPVLVNHLVNLTSPPEQYNRKTEGLKVTDWTTFIWKPPDAPTVTLTCHQHATGTTDRVHTFTPETKTATPLALSDHFNQAPTTPPTPGRTGWPSRQLCTGRWMPQQQTPRCPRRGSLSLATWQPTQENTGHHGRNAGYPGHQTRKEPSNFAAPAYKNTRTNFEVCVRNKDRHTASFKTPCAEASPRAGARTTPAQAEASSRGRWHLGPPGQSAQAGNESGPSAASARSTAKAKSQGVPILHRGGTYRHAPRMARQRGSTRGVWGHAQRPTEAVCMVPVQDTGQTGHSWPTWQPAAEDQMAGAPGVRRESGNLEPRTLGRQAVPRVPGTAPHTRQLNAAGHRLDS